MFCRFKHINFCSHQYHFQLFNMSPLTPIWRQFTLLNSFLINELTHMKYFTLKQSAVAVTLLQEEITPETTRMQNESTNQDKNEWWWNLLFYMKYFYCCSKTVSLTGLNILGESNLEPLVWMILQHLDDVLFCQQYWSFKMKMLLRDQLIFLR